MITFETWSEVLIPNFPPNSNTKGALEVLKWAYDTYQDDLVYACSFGVEGIVLIELISRIKQDADILFLDTECHFEETYQTITKVKERYPALNIKLQKPALSMVEQADQYGQQLFRTDPDKCCELRKIIPLQQALMGYTAWISGLRREQSARRNKTNYINLDKKFNKIKICPLIYWTWADVWQFVHQHDLTYNPLHDHGYPSIGCAPCTQPSFYLGDFRAGRWVGTAKTECGLHS